MALRWPPTSLSRRRPVRQTRRGTVAAVTWLVIAIAAQCTIGAVRLSAYGADDIWASQYRAYGAASGQSLWQQWIYGTSVWMTGQGRFFPATVADWLVAHATFATRESYKAFQLVIALVAFTVFAAWAVRAFRDMWAGVLALLVVLACTQFRFFYDPILHFAGQQPLLVIEVFGALVLLQVFTRGGRPQAWAAVAAAVLWALALCTYESAYLFAPAAVLTVWPEPGTRSRRLWASAMVVVPTALVGIFVAVLRTRADHPSEVYSASLQPMPFVTTLGKQVFASLPMSYTWTHHGHVLPSVLHAFQPSLAWFGLFLAVSATAALALLSIGQPARARHLAIAVFGLSLVLGAAAVVAVSRFWQHTLTFGLGYIGVFVQSFGLALLVVSLVAAVPYGSGRSAEIARYVLALTGGLLLGWVVVANAQQNLRVVTASDPRLGSWASQRTLGFPRELTEAAFRHGIMSGYQSRTIYGNPGGPWFDGPYLSSLAGERVEVPNPWPFGSLAPDASTELPSCTPPAASLRCDKPITAVTVRAQDYADGVVVLAWAEAITDNARPGWAASVRTRRARVYSSGSNSERRLCARLPDTGKVVWPTASRVIASGTGWVISDVVFPAPGVDATTIGAFNTVDGSCQ